LYKVLGRKNAVSAGTVLEGQKKLKENPPEGTFNVNGEKLPQLSRYILSGPTDKILRRAGAERRR